MNVDVHESSAARDMSAPRRLAAILAADVAGCTLLMDADEEGAFGFAAGQAGRSAPAGQLHLGMTEQDVTRIMGEPAKVTDYVAGGIDKSRLEYQGQIPGTVILSAGKTTGIALDVFRIEKGDLPSFSRRAWPGMASAAVRQALGEPSEILHHAFYGTKLDQWCTTGPAKGK